jgi:internalin A
MMLVVLVVGGGPGWYVACARRQAETIKVIRELGGRIAYDWEYRDGEFADTSTKTPWPDWMMNQIGPEYFATVTYVGLDKSLDSYDESLRSRLRALRRLEYLDDLSGEPTTDSGLAALAELDQLLYLAIQGKSVSNAGLVHLKKMTRLEELHTWSLAIDDAGLANLSGLTALKRLSLRTNRISDDGLVHLESLTNLKELRLIGVGNDHSGDWDIQYENSKITSAGLVHLARMSRLEALFLDRQRIANLAPIRHLSSLRTLGLDHTAIDDSGLEPITSLIGLKTLILDGTAITDASMANLAKLSNLESLSLKFTRLDGAGMAPLAKLSNLRTLDLSFSTITNAGLSSVGSLSNLENLDLYSTNITDAGVAQLGRLSRCQDILLPRTTSWGTMKSLEAKLPGAVIRTYQYLSHPPRW